MPIDQPYYAKHQVLTGQYTAGGELVTKGGEDYVGGYHILPNGQYFSGFSPNTDSVQLYEKRFDQTSDVKLFNRINNLEISKYQQPISYLLIPTLDDYNDGFVYRYFIQKRNNPLVTIMEINSDQFNTINTRNKAGINGVIYKSIVIKWKLNGSYIAEFNQREIENSETLGFIGLRGYLTNLYQFSK